jgi:hypothetical protein
MADSSSDKDNDVPPEKRPTPRGPSEKRPTTRGPSENPLGRLSGNFSKHKLGKIVGGGQGKKKYPVRQCRVCSVHKKQSETRYICEFCVVALHKGSCFEKYHTLKHYQAIRVLKTPSDITMHELQLRNISRNILLFKSFNALKMSENWGSKFKRPHRSAMC